MILSTFWSLPNISLSSAINLSKSANSFSIFSLSNPVSLLSLISSIAFDWTSLKPNLLIKPFLASSSELEPRINLITSSIWSKAIFKPSKICTLFSALSKSNLVLLIIISLWKSIYLAIISFNPKVFGTPWSSIKKIIP